MAKKEKSEEVLSKGELKKLAEAIKESELEENIEKSEEIIQDNKFQEFFKPESFSPVLEKVQETPEINLEQVAATHTLLEKPKEEDGFNYAATPEQKDEPKYQHTESINYATLENTTTDINKLTIDPLERRETRFMPSEQGGFKSSNVETYISPKKTEIQKLGTQDPFERKEVKYKASR